MKKITKAIIPAAGLGTRFLPVTKSLPKEMLPIIDTPNIYYIIKEAVLAGITDFLIIVSRNKTAIEDFFDINYELEMRLKNSGKEKELEMIHEVANIANIQYVHQKEPAGLGDAILYGESFIGKDDAFAVLLGDDLISYEEKSAIGELIEAYNKTQGTILGCKEVPLEMTKKYGIVTPKDDPSKEIFEIKDMVEKPKENPPSNIAVLGRYILPNEIFKILKETKIGVGGELQLTDAIKNSLNNRSCYACKFTGERYDIGDKFGYIKATIDYALKRDDLKNKVLEYLQQLLK